MTEPEVIAEVTPSVETPVVETPNVETPEAPVTPETPVVETPKAEERFKLPDGREVSSMELYDLHVNKLLPDYTKKSQELATYKNINKPQDEVPSWKQPDYIPQSYAEVIDLAKQEAIAEIRRQAEAETARTKEVATYVDTQIAEIRKSDTSLDENALFLHANKFGFRDLKAAHANMQAIKQAAVDAEQRTLKNLKARGIEPINAGATPSVDTGAIDYNAIAERRESALDFLGRIKGN